MRRLGIAIIIAALATTGAYGRQAAATRTGAAAQLEAAIKKETVDGDLKAAIELYKKLTSSTDRAVAAQAWAHIGQCYEKLGAAQVDEARKAYEQLVKLFGDQKDLVAQAQARLAALGAAGVPGATSRVYESGSGSVLGLGFPRLSDDGRFVVSPVTGTHALPTELGVRNLVTGDERRLTLPSGQAVRGGAMSPDARRIAYVTMRNAAGEETIGMIGSDGSGARIVITHKGVVGVPQWSPDGKRLFDVVTSADLASLEVIAVEADSGVTTRLGRLRDGSVDVDTVAFPGLPISPDGRFVALAKAKAGSTEIVVIELATGTETRVADQAVSRTAIWWTGDSRGLVFTDRRDGSTALMLQRLSAGQPDGPPRVLKATADDLSDATALGLTREGSLFYWRLPMMWATYVVSLNEASGTIQPSTAKVTGVGPGVPCGHDWSPDGAELVFGARLEAERATTTGGLLDRPAPCTLLGIKPVMGGRARVLSPGLSTLRRPRWSPDGKTILVQGSKNGVVGIYGIDSATGTATLVVAFPQNAPFGNNAIAADWAIDGKGLFIGRFLVGTYTVAYRDLASGAETERFSVRNPSLLLNEATSVARDGTLCMLIGEGGESATRSIALLPPGGSEPRPVLRSGSPTPVVGGACAPDGRSIWAVQGRPNSQAPNSRALLRVPVDGGAPVEANLVLRGLDNLRVSPDGTKLLVTALDMVSEIWKIDRLVPSR